MTLKHFEEVPSEDSIPEVFRVGNVDSFNVYELTIDRLQYIYSCGLTAVEYTEFCLERIRRVDPYIESIIEINPDALSIARSLDVERRQGHIRSSLHGVPVLVKDNMATKDKMQTTAGSWALLGSIVPRDAYVVERLRLAGAIILGHTNMSEWSSVRSKQFSTGYSPRRGQVRNPYNLSRSPFGSSSGSAVSVSANIVPLSFGTETDSSIVGPASINGIVGIKPTVGLTSRNGVIPISANLDTVGSFGRTVADAVHGFNAIVGADNRDTHTLNPSRPPEQNYLLHLSTKAALQGAKFGLPWKRCWELVPEDLKRVASRVFNAIAEAGGEVMRTEFPCADERIGGDGRWNWEHGDPENSEFTVVKSDAYNGINQYLSDLTCTDIKTVEDIVKYNNENRGTEGAYSGDHQAFPSGQDNFHDVVESKGKRDSTYLTALNHIQTQCREHGVDAALNHIAADGKTIKLDALLLCDRLGPGQQIAAQAGYPVISIPIGLDDEGLPVGLSLQHTAWEEGTLIKWASAIESVVRETLGWRPTPTYHNHLAKNIPIL